MLEWVMDRRKFIVGSAAVTTGAATFAVVSPAQAGVCEDNLYSPAKPAVRITYPELPGETPQPINFEFPPGAMRRYYYW
jgi:hypothetical protein